MLALDGVENFLPAAAEEFEIDGEGFVYFFNERQAAEKPFVGALDFELHHLAEGVGIEILSQIFFRHCELPQVFERKINSAFGIVDGDVLPEIGELQSGAGVIGELLAFGVVIAAEIEDEMADRIGRVTAVGENIVKGFETGDGLVLAEGDEEIGEFVFRDGELVHRGSESNENGMAGHASIAGVEFDFPFVEQGERRGGIADFVAEIVGNTAVGVEVEEILTEMLGKKPGGYRKIFIVRAGKLAAVFVGFGERGSGGRDGVGRGQAGPSLRE